MITEFLDSVDGLGRQLRPQEAQALAIVCGLLIEVWEQKHGDVGALREQRAAHLRAAEICAMSVFAIQWQEAQEWRDERQRGA